MLNLTNEVFDLLEGVVLPEFCDNKNKCASFGLSVECSDEYKLASVLRSNLGNEIQQKLT